MYGRIVKMYEVAPNMRDYSQGCMSCLEYGEDVRVLVSIVSDVVLMEFAQEILVVPAQGQTLLKAYIYSHIFRRRSGRISCLVWNLLFEINVQGPHLESHHLLPKFSNRLSPLLPLTDRALENILI